MSGPASLQYGCWPARNVEACNQTLEGHLKPEHFEKAVRPEREFVKGRRNDDG